MPKPVMEMNVVMELPTILAGPLIRRVEPQGVHIWIALSKEFEVAGELYSIQKNSTEEVFDYVQIHAKSKTKRIRIGKKLYVYIIKIIPISGHFPQEALLGYNLSFSNKKESYNLESFHLLSKDHPNSVVYGNLKYPSFYISGNKKTATILYGSCRKLHGKGDDALAGGDLKLSETYANLEQRPGALFLLGDQIYADDVADPVFLPISILGQELIGVEEDPVKIDNRLGFEPFKTAINQIHGRQTIIEQLCRFTSGKGSNHLMKFSEFAVMYLLSFSPDLWSVITSQNMIRSFEELQEKNMFHSCENRDKEKMEHLRLQYEEQLEGIHRFKKTLPAVRRLLANIPTYMIFDDHDITDDWNISLQWMEDVGRSPLGKHVIANGLAAYWIFQGWGNDPEQFDDSFLKKMEPYFHTFQTDSISYYEWQKALLEFDSWSFVAPTSPRALFLDTRTNRDYEKVSNNIKNKKLLRELSEGAQLIGKKGWKKAHHLLLKNGWEPNGNLIIVSPAPLYGIGLIETVAKRFVLPLKILNVPVQTVLDLEAWVFNQRAYYNFHRFISNFDPATCIILSGDAHMASSAQATIMYENGQKRTLFQFTSSPMNNQSVPKLLAVFLKSVLSLYDQFINRENVFQSSSLSARREVGFDDQELLRKEVVDYSSLENGCIIETKNNLGLISIEDGSIENSLLQYKGSRLLSKRFRDFRSYRII